VIEKNHIIQVNHSTDIVLVRQRVREWAIELGFSLVDQTKMVTAASEMARNMIDFATKGTVYMEIINQGDRKGMKLTFEDRGPGIPDLEMAMKDGYTTRGGLGLGMSGSKRLVNEFNVSSRVGEGTRVTIARWK
jgi:serine/threonine-protein kinase RsbT